MKNPNEAQVVPPQKKDNTTEILWIIAVGVILLIVIIWVIARSESNEAFMSVAQVIAQLHT